MSDQAVVSHHRFINSGKNVSLHIENLCSDTIQKTLLCADLHKDKVCF